MTCCRFRNTRRSSPPSVVVTALSTLPIPKPSPTLWRRPAEQINGTENMLYMFSQAASDGTLTLTITF